MEVLKNKGVLAFIGVVVVLLVAGGIFYFVSASSQNSEAEPVAEESTLKQVSPEEIGLTLELSKDKKEVVMKIAKLDGIKSIEYEASYDAEEEDKESGESLVITQGVTSGEPLVVKSGDKELKREITLGTCSANVCRYHTVASDIQFIIKVNYANGEIGQVETTLSYPQSE